jgi:hypothetical protein
MLLPAGISALPASYEIALIILVFLFATLTARR